jgi:hypothetical protein
VTILCAGISYLVLPIRLITVGIAVSFGIGYFSSSLLARHLLSKRIGSLTIRRELISILIISAIAFVPGFLISNLLNSDSPNLASSLLALLLAGAIAIPIYLGIGYRLKVASIVSATDLLKKKLAKR